MVSDSTRRSWILFSIEKDIRTGQEAVTNSVDAITIQRIQSRQRIISIIHITECHDYWRWIEHVAISDLWCFKLDQVYDGDRAGLHT